MRANPIPLLLITLLLLTAPASAGVFKPAPKNGVPDLYMVVLENDVAARPGRPAAGLPKIADVARALGSAHDGAVEEVWEYANAFVIRMPEARARKLAKDPRVKAVEQDFAVSAPVAMCGPTAGGWTDTRTLPTSTPSTQPISCPDPDPLNDTTGPSADPLCKDNWGLDQIDQAGAARDSAFTFGNNGAGVHIYVVDTGVNWNHREFKGANGVTRVSGGVDAARASTVIPGTSSNTNDCNGHGTHATAIIAGRTFGVAKAALIHPVYIGGCGGSLGIYQSRVARGLNWIAGNAQHPAVVNWSGGNDKDVVSNLTVQSAVQAVIDADITIVQAAGNQSKPTNLLDSCAWSMGGVIPAVIVAGGMDYHDGRWSRRPDLDPNDETLCGSDCGSNVGSCIDIWAPAAHILSANKNATDLTCQLGGTSMAAPHVTGVVALYLQSHPTAAPAEVDQALRSIATWGRLDDNPASTNYIGRDSDNVILFSGTGSTGNPAPAASFTFNCPGRQCTFDATGSSDPGGAITEYLWRFPDGTTDTGASVIHVFPASSTNSVVLRVTDNSSPTPKTDHLLRSVTVNANAPPTASFTRVCDGLGCTFNSQSSTDDVGVVSSTWTFGDGAGGSGTEVSHTYSAGGTYTVTLVVTDSAGQTGTASQTFSLTPNLSAPANTVATASGSTVTIAWTPAANASGYDLYRKVSAADWMLAKFVSGGSASSTTDTPPSSSNGVVLYRLVTRAGANSSLPGSADSAYVGSFTDGTLAVPPLRTVLKAEHITEMRIAVNGLRALNGDAAVYIGPSIDPNTLRAAVIEDTVWTELMQSLNSARAALSLPPITWRTPPGNGVVQRTQIEDLHLGVQ